MLPNLLELEQVSFSYGADGSENHVLHDLNLKIRTGDYITVIGGNGEGKSTLLRMIAEFRPSYGRLLFKNENISSMPHHKRAAFIRYLSQNTRDIIVDSLTLEEQFALTLNRHKWFSLKRNVTKYTRERIKDILRKLEMGLEDRVNETLLNFSGGERQAIALSLAIAAKPDVLLLDEHTAALDIKNTVMIENMTDSIIKEYGLTALWVTHNLRQAVKYGNRIVLIHKGKIVEDFEGADRKNMKEETLRGILEGYLIEAGDLSFSEAATA